MRNDKSLFLSLYSIFDKKNNMFQPPFTEFSEVDAARRFDGLMRNTDTIISRYKDDFSLVMLGTLDLTTGEIVPDYHVICDCNDVSNII